MTGRFQTRRLKEPDMQQHRSVSDFDATLMAHFAHRGDVLIAGGGYLRNDPRDESEIFAPDCMVAFCVDPRAIVSRNGYVIQHAGKPPDFVLESSVPQHGTARLHCQARGLRRLRSAGVLAVRPHRRAIP